MSYIYNKVSGTGRKTQPSFGTNERFTQQVLVGTGPKNSHTLAEFTVERQAHDDGTVSFRLWLDGELIKVGALRDGVLYNASSYVDNTYPTQVSAA